MMVTLSLPNRTLALLHRLAQRAGLSLDEYCERVFFDVAGCNNPRHWSRLIAGRTALARCHDESRARLAAMMGVRIARRRVAAGAADGAREATV